MNKHKKLYVVKDQSIKYTCSFHQLLKTLGLKKPIRPYVLELYYRDPVGFSLYLGYKAYQTLDKDEDGYVDIEEWNRLTADLSESYLEAIVELEAKLLASHPEVTIQGLEDLPNILTTVGDMHGSSQPREKHAQRDNA